MAVAIGLLSSCEPTLPPLRGALTIGGESYVIFVAGTSPAGGDLYAVGTDGGPAVQVTFTTVGEMQPELSPDGRAVAFLRGASLRDSTPGSVWVLDLLTGADRELSLPTGSATPRRVGWAPNGASVVVRTDNGLYRLGAPPRPANPAAISGAGRVAAESSLSVLLGSPVFARVVPCAEPGALCVAGDTGAPGPLARSARDALRWGTDSVAFLIGDQLEVRPLGPGRARRLLWSGFPGHPRQPTAFITP
ncbi:MAG TPA: hypothetical protein VH763_07445 [Gemmatimonadales bacterium]|jgi:hypothetical protein